MANTRHANQIADFVKFVAGQITTALSGNDEFSQTTFDGPTDTRLMR